MRHAVRHRLPIVAVVLAAAIVFPLGAWASHQFTDVPNTNTFHADIAAIREAGVTTGCSPTAYCPKDFVTREQMAAFLNRLGALGPGKTPVVNAATAEEAGYAEEADTVDGHDVILAAEDIVIETLFPWLPFPGNPAVTIEQVVDGTWIKRDVSGSGAALLPLDGPGFFGNLEYGLKTIEVCYAASPDVTITETDVVQATGSGTGSTTLILNDEIRPMSADACYTLTDLDPDASAGGVSVVLNFDYAAAATATIGKVRATWTPTNLAEN